MTRFFFKLLGVALLLIIVCAVSYVLPKSAAKPSRLIQGINTNQLLKILAVESSRVNMKPNGVAYFIGHRDKGIDGEVVVGVFPTIALAQKTFISLCGGRQIAPMQVTLPLPGDEFKCWSGPGLYHGKQVIGSSCLLRRENALISFFYSGPVQEAIAMSHKIDRELLNSQILAPKGIPIPLPTVELTAPETVTLGNGLSIKFRSPQGDPIRINGFGGSDYSSPFAAEGRVVYDIGNKLGPAQVTVVMVSADNVIYTRTLHTTIVRRRKL